MTKNDNLSKLVEVPMYLEEGVDVRSYGLDPRDIRTIKIGSRKIKVIYVQTESEKKDALMSLFWERVNEYNKDARSRRCMIEGKYGPIRCPESNKCSECERIKDGSILSLDQLLMDSAFEPADTNDIETEIIYEEFLADLIDYLEDIHPNYGRVFKLLYDGITVRHRIAEVLDIPTGTIKDWVPKIKSLAQAFYKAYME